MASTSTAESKTSVPRAYEIIWYGWSADENKPIRQAYLMLFSVWLVCVSQLINPTKLLPTYEELKFYSQLNSELGIGLYCSCKPGEIQPGQGFAVWKWENDVGKSNLVVVSWRKVSTEAVSVIADQLQAYHHPWILYSIDDFWWIIVIVV
jgi:hypothetical protein